jgi:hypothetical protein
LPRELEKAATPRLFLTPSDLHHIGFGELARPSHRQPCTQAVASRANRRRQERHARNVAAIHAPPNVENEEMKLGFTGWTPIWLNDSHFRLIWKSRRPVSMVSGGLWLSERRLVACADVFPVI